MRAGRPRSRVGPPPITLAPQGDMRRLAGPQPVPMRQCRHASCVLAILRVPSWITLLPRRMQRETGLFQVSRAIWCLPVSETLS